MGKGHRHSASFIGAIWRGADAPRALALKVVLNELVETKVAVCDKIRDDREGVKD